MLTGTRCIFLQATLALALPCLGMDHAQREPIVLKQLGNDPTKHKITKNSFNEAIKAVQDRINGDRLAAALSLQLRDFAGQELSLQEWQEHVSQAYNDFIDSLDILTMVATMRSHPPKEILEAMACAIR